MMTFPKESCEETSKSEASMREGFLARYERDAQVLVHLLSLEVCGPCRLAHKRACTFLFTRFQACSEPQHCRFIVSKSQNISIPMTQPHEHEYCDVCVNRSDDSMLDVCFQESQRTSDFTTTTVQQRRQRCQSRYMSVIGCKNAQIPSLERNQ